jgi:hypothetical protein
LTARPWRCARQTLRPPLGWDPITSASIYGEYDAVLVDPLTTVFEANALGDWVCESVADPVSITSSTRPPTDPSPYHLSDLRLYAVKTLDSTIRLSQPWACAGTVPE